MMMHTSGLSLFFAGDITPQSREYVLDENNSRHCVQVLRMQEGDPLLLTDGKGYRYSTVIRKAHRKNCMVDIRSAEQFPARKPRLHIAISFTRQGSRTEWFLEKATEIGADEIYPLICERTAKEHYKAARLQQIMISAMLQSQQYYLPVLHEPVQLPALLSQGFAGQKFIAHCLPEQQQPLSALASAGEDALILIGPEGDFTPDEINVALEQGFLPVLLGDTRLRTETAGIVACALLREKLQER